MPNDRSLLDRELDRVELRSFTLDGFYRRRERQLRNRRIRAGVVALLIAAVGTGALVRAFPSGQIPADEDRRPSPAESLGIFGPAAGRIVSYADSRLWAVDPSAPSPSSTLAPLDLGTGDADQRFASFTVPLGWSSDGTKLLFLREDPTDLTFPHDRHLYILHADGTETQVTREPVDGAAISPDGSRVVFAVDDPDDAGLFAVDVGDGRPVRIGEGEEPTFSPDGTQIAYLSLPRSGGQVEAGREQVWLANADGTGARELLADEPVLAEGVFGLTWSPAGDRIAMENTLEGDGAIYTFAPDGSDFTKVITGGANPYWSPDGSQIAYAALGSSPGFSVANADGSEVRTFDFGISGPWHPGTLEESAEAPASPSPSTSPSPRSSRFTSTVHGIAIDPPAGWQTRPAIEPWTGEALDFDSPAADVISDPALGDRLYMVVASQPYEGLSEDAWRDKVIEWLCTEERMAAGSWTVDGARSFVVTCGSTASAARVFTDTRGYLIRLVASSDEPGVANTYDWDWHKLVLETVDLRPQEALDGPSSS